MEKSIIYWENYRVTQCEICQVFNVTQCQICQVFKEKWSEIIWYQMVVKEEKIFRRKCSLDTLRDTATFDFGCASLSVQSKKEHIWCWFSKQTVSVNLGDLCQI